MFLRFYNLLEVVEREYALTLIQFKCSKKDTVFNHLKPVKDSVLGLPTCRESEKVKQ